MVYFFPLDDGKKTENIMFIIIIIIIQMHRSFNANNESLLQLSQHQDIGNCPDHHKKYELICTQDNELLCSHCAIFGGHRHHKLKTIADFDSQIEETIKSMNDIALRKRESDEEIRGKQFQSSIIKQLNQKKDQLIKQTRQNYRKVYQFVKDAEQKTYTDLVRAFRAIDGEMNLLNSQKSEIQKEYKRWWSNCKNFVDQIKKANSIKEKVSLFYDQQQTQFLNLNGAKKHIDKLQEKNHEIKTSLFHLINDIKIEFDFSLEKNIYNYAFVRTNFPNKNSETPKKKQIFMVRSLHLDNQNTSHGSFEQRAVLSPGNKIQKNIKLTKTLPKKFLQKRTGPVRMIPKYQNLEQIKHSENLQFAQRMLNNFLESKNHLDLTGCSLTDSEVFYVMEKASQQKQIKSLNLSKNKLTNTGFLQLVYFLEYTTNINLSYNMLTEQILDQLLNWKDLLQKLRIINLTHNRIINERRAKNKIQDLKKLGVIVTL